MDLGAEGISGEKAIDRIMNDIEAIISEERDRQHRVLADRLEETLDNPPAKPPALNGNHQGRMMDRRKTQSLFHESDIRRQIKSARLRCFSD